MIINQITSGGGGGIDTFDATAYPEHILEGYTAYARGAKIIGTYVPAEHVVLDEYTKLLIHFDQDFADDCGNTVYSAGTPTINNIIYKFANGSGSFGADADHIYVYPNEATYFFAKDFTIDFWIYPTVFTGTRWIFIQRRSFQVEHSIAAYFTSDAKIRLATSINGTTLVTTTFNTPLVANVWQHIAIVRNLGVIKCYFNGVADSITYAVGTNVIFQSMQPFRIGGAPDPNQSSASLLDEFRISNGIARWTDNFTPADAPYSIYKSGTG